MEYFIQQMINGITLGSIYGLIAIGMSIFLSNLVQVTQGPRNKPVPSMLGEVITLSGGASYAVTLSYKQIMIVAVTVVLLAAFWYVVQHTSLGRAQRACEQDRRM